MTTSAYNPALERNPPRHLLGWWVNDTDSPAQTLATEARTFASLEDTAPQRFVGRDEPHGGSAAVNTILLDRMHQMQADDGLTEGIRLDYVERFVSADKAFFQWLAQIIGSCVASGGMRVVTIRSIWEVLILGQFEETLGRVLTGSNDNIAPFAPYHYGWGRKHAGIGGYGDGSTCGGQIAAFMSEGWLPCSTPGLDSDRFPEPRNTRTYRDWGAGRHLSEFKAAGQLFDLVESESMNDAETMIARLDQGKPAMICSGWGFAPAHQHKDGFWVYRRSGSWAHNMSIVGWRKASDGNVFIYVKNSWGMNAHKDGDGFWIPIEVFASWLRSAQCRTIGELKQRDAELAIAL